MLNEFSLGAKLLKRDWNSGELKVLLLALIIAVTSMTSISLFIQRIDKLMLDQSGEFLGADLILQSPNRINENIITESQQLNLKTSSAISFTSVVVANENFQLAHIKAVDEHYPLLSQIKTSTALYGDETLESNGPGIGEAWLAPRLFNLLNINIGDSIELGERKLQVTSVLKYDPGQGFSFISMAPKLLMNLQDVESTGIIQPGSRLTYLLGLTGEQKNRKKFQQWVTPKLDTSQQLIGGTEGSEAINTAVDKAKQYLSLASMLSIMLSGIAIAIAANRYGERHYNQAALMRCMGSQQKSIIQIFASQLFILGVLACGLGCMLGYASQHIIAALLTEIFNTALPPMDFTSLFNGVLSGFISGFITLTGFSLPSLLRLQSIPPLKVLRDELTPLSLSLWFVYGLAAASTISVMWWLSGELQLTLMVLLGTIACTLILFFISSSLVYISKTIVPYLSGPMKVGMQQIIRHKRQNQLQMLAIGLSLMILMLIFLIRNDLLVRWQNQLPEQAPNHFIINIQEHETHPIKQALENNNIKTEGIYPMVRGRIIKINGKNILQDVGEKKQLDQALKRELNISWNNALQNNNQLIQGSWWTTETLGKPYISVEQGLAKRLGIETGDSLTFKVADQEISASILNIRSVQWDSFQPNFFIIFPDGVINQFPATYISSFFLPSQNKNILNSLIKQFPSITVLEIDDLMNQVKSIIQQVSTTIGYVMLFVLFAGITVLTASMQSNMDNRIQSAVIMRTLGASKSFLQRSHLTEFALLGYLSGLLGVIGAEIISYFLYTQVFKLDFEPHFMLWLIGPLLGSLLIVLISKFYMRDVTRLSPNKILK